MNLRANWIVLDVGSMLRPDGKAVAAVVPDVSQCEAFCYSTPGCAAYTFCTNQAGCSDKCPQHVAKHPSSKGPAVPDSCLDSDGLMAIVMVIAGGKCLDYCSHCSHCTHCTHPSLSPHPATLTTSHPAAKEDTSNPPYNLPAAALAPQNLEHMGFGPWGPTSSCQGDAWPYRLCTLKGMATFLPGEMLPKHDSAAVPGEGLQRDALLVQCRWCVGGSLHRRYSRLQSVV